MVPSHRQKARPFRQRIEREVQVTDPEYFFSNGRAPPELRSAVTAACGGIGTIKRFQAKWTPVRAKKTRQNKSLVLRSDSIATEMALITPTLGKIDPKSWTSQSH
jgi:hypothetical protein